MGNTDSSAFPYTPGVEVSAYRAYKTGWKMYDGVDTNSSAPVTIFTFDKTDTGPAYAAAKNYMAKLRNLLHPTILRYLNSAETATHIHIVTEPVRPLTLPIDVADEDVPAGTAAKASPAATGAAAAGGAAAGATSAPQLTTFSRQEVTAMLLALGLSQVITGLQFLNERAKIVHGNLRPSSVFVASNGDWKLGGFDLAFKCEATASPIPLPDQAAQLGSVPHETRLSAGVQDDLYASPEWAAQRWRELEAAPVWSVDAWSLACLIYHCFAGAFRRQSEVNSAQGVPAQLAPLYRRLLSPSPLQRPSPTALLESLFFCSPVVSVVNFVDNMAVKTAEEKKKFFTDFALLAPSLPRSIVRQRVLPQMLALLEFGTTNGNPFDAVLAAALRLAKATLPAGDISKTVAPVLVRLYRNPERGVRVHLLNQLAQYAEYLPAEAVAADVFPPLVAGLRDVHPILRGLTVRSIPLIAQHLSRADIETKVLSALAPLQADQQPENRVNVTYCLAKLAAQLSPEAQEKVLLPAFARALRDTFPPARVASLASFTATLDLHGADTCARRILPFVSPSCVDPSPEVRQAALRLVAAITPRLVKRHQELKDLDAARASAAANATGLGSNGAIAGAAGGAGAAAATASTGYGATGDGNAGSGGAKGGGMWSSMGSWAANAVSSAVMSAVASSGAAPAASPAAGSSSSAGSPSVATSAAATATSAGASLAVAKPPIAALPVSFGATPAGTSGPKPVGAAKKAAASKPLDLVSFESKEKDATDALDFDFFGDMGSSSSVGSGAGAGGGASGKAAAASLSLGGGFSALSSGGPAASSSSSSSSWDSWGDMAELAPTSPSSNPGGGNGSWDLFAGTGAAPATAAAAPSAGTRPSSSSVGAVTAAAAGMDWGSLSAKPKPAAATGGSGFGAMSLTSPSSAGGGLASPATLSATKGAGAAPAPAAAAAATSTGKDSFDDWSSFLNPS